MLIKKAPLEIFQNTVKYFPTVSVNIVLRNNKGEFLFVCRKNNPMKGWYWVPGGRVLAGESIHDAAVRILREETGVTVFIKYQSKEYFEEIFDTAFFDENDWKIYLQGITCVHYLATAVYAELDGENTSVVLDSQSNDFLWSKDIPKEHPYLMNYFRAVEN